MLHRLENKNGLVLKVSAIGAAVTQLLAPDRNGDLADITLGYDEPEHYLENPPYFGVVVGRCANRIAGGRFTLDGKAYTLATNNGPNHLHGGVRGIDKHTWEAERIQSADGPSIRLTRVSPDGEEGYPGTLSLSVTYTLTHRDELMTEMEATTDAPTLCNLAHHAYWNLAGHAAGSIGKHELTLHASRYTPMDATAIPTGEIAPVAGTPFDFTRSKAIGKDLEATGGDPAGYDHNFVVDGALGELRPVARVVEPESGRVLELSANQPGVQFYTANFLDGTVPGKGGVAYQRHGAFCLETQNFPDAINKPEWPSPVLRPGETYRHVMVARFTTV